jgi:hypothetical protein
MGAYQKLKSLKTGLRWTTALIDRLWELAWRSWEHRNEVLRERENEVSREQGSRMNRKVTEAFNNLNRRAIPQKDRHILQIPLRRILLKDCPYKETWLHNADSALQAMRRASWKVISRE